MTGDPLLRVALLTTYFPRHDDDYAGRFVSDLVYHVEKAGVEFEVVKPGVFNDYGLAYGAGVVRNAKRRPWLVPLMLVSMARALRRAARSADLVHIHWLLAAPLGLLAGKPWVVTLHGTPSAGAFEDLVLLRRARWLVGPLLKRAKAVICVSQVLTEAVGELGARAVWIPNGTTVPDEVCPEEEPPELLFAGRMVEEKGIWELAEAAEGLNLVVAGDGPLRHVLPQARGLVPHTELERLYRRAAVVVMPSHSEGQGVVAIEAMAHGRPVVGSRVGGLAEIVVDGETGILVPPRDAAALRRALLRLLDDPALRAQMGAAGRRRITELCSWDRITPKILETYRLAATV
ncbi:MAG TPA: glycosyltransferase family 4 protein [Gaiellaceae bacterium]|nr:glycosyltransferase family 4 protein [Gaiellaceae bacterium]